MQFHEKKTIFGFFPRGCGGNANNFDTKQLCQEACMPTWTPQAQAILNL